jgi:hypothetical protein
MREDFQFPLTGRARIALIDADFRAASGMRTFRFGDDAELRGFAPDSLALPLNSALVLADRKLRCLIDLPTLKRAVVVFTDELMLPHHRDLIWKAFGLPIFEQLRDEHGRVIARECEVHDGLHFDPSLIASLEEIVEINRGVCECGAETPRLQRLLVPASRAAAA